MGRQVTDYLLYRWRYFLGYSLIGITFLGMLIVAGLYIPGGISKAEMQSVVLSNTLSLSFSAFDAHMIIDLPYHLLQRTSIELFGVTPLSMKLPSLFLGFLSAAGMLILLNMWFRHNVAVITAILVVTTGQFLFVAQHGTPSIVYIFWSIWLLVAAMMVSRQARWVGIWKVLLFGIAALSLYTPLSAYILIALVSAIILHPHLRYLVRRLSKPKLIVALACAVIIVLPLLYATVRHPSIGLSLLGIPSERPDISANVTHLFKQYFDFASPSAGLVLNPIYGLGPMILIGLGVFRLITTKYTARSYIIASWIILLLPVLIINPSYVSITFVPVMLLMAMGISWLLSRWYQLFPRNPYARLAGLIPLAVLIGGMVFSGIDRYMYGYLYSPQTATHFSNDLYLLNGELTKQQVPTTLFVSAAEAPFYTVVAHHYKDVSVSTSSPQLPAPSTTTVVSQAAYQPTKTPPHDILVSDISQRADRFYIYKTDTK